MRPAAPQVAPGDPLARAAGLMETFAVRELPVVDGRLLVGILARSDLHPHLGNLEWTPVRLAMTSPARTIAPDTTLRAVARALLAGSFNGIPVVIDGVVAGMINRQDLLRVLAECPVDADG